MRLAVEVNKISISRPGPQIDSLRHMLFYQAASTSVPAILTSKTLRSYPMKDMTKFLGAILLTSVFSVAANAACPSYTGKYLCTGNDKDDDKDNDIVQEMNLKTEMIGDQYQYTLDDAIVLADGVTRPVKFQGGVFDIAASCTEDSVTVRVMLPGGEGDNEACGAQKWDIFYTLMFKPDNTNIAENHYSEAVCADGKIVPSEEKGELSCVPVVVVP